MRQAEHLQTPEAQNEALTKAFLHGLPARRELSARLLLAGGGGFHLWRHVLFGDIPRSSFQSCSTGTNISRYFKDLSPILSNDTTRNLLCYQQCTLGLDNKS